MRGVSLSPDELGQRLMEVYDRVGPLYRRAMRAVEITAGERGVSVGMRAVLDVLRQAGDQTVPQIAALLVLTRQFVQRMVNDALERGWVELRENPAHRRSSLVALTADGRAVIAAVIAGEHATMGTAPGDLTAADIDTCLRVLDAMLAVSLPEAASAGGPRSSRPGAATPPPGS